MLAPEFKLQIYSVSSMVRGVLPGILFLAKQPSGNVWFLKRKLAERRNQPLENTFFLNDGAPENGWFPFGFWQPNTKRKLPIFWDKLPAATTPNHDIPIRVASAGLPNGSVDASEF